MPARLARSRHPSTSTASHAQPPAAQPQQEPQQERERVSREEADRRSAGEPAAVQIIQPARRPPACIRYPCPPLHPSTPPERRQRRREERGEDRTGEGRAVAPHRPQFSRRGHNIANQPPTRPSQARRRPVIVRPPSPCRLPPAVNSAFGEFAEPPPETATADGRTAHAPPPTRHQHRGSLHIFASPAIPKELLSTLILSRIRIFPLFHARKQSRYLPDNKRNKSSTTILVISPKM